MTTTPDEPLNDDDMTTGMGDATGSVPSAEDADGSDGGDADGTDGGDADASDG